MRIPTGSTDRWIYFVAVDGTDLKTRLTGLAIGSFLVEFSQAGAAYGTPALPTVQEVGSGVYAMLLSQGLTLPSGDDTQEVAYQIAHTVMAPVTRVVELYRPKATEGQTLGLTSGDLSATALSNVPVDGGFNLEQSLSLIAAAVCGQIANAGAAAESFQGLDKATTRVAADVDASGNRSNAVYTP